MVKIGEENYSAILKEEYPINELPGVTYTLHEEDFIQARGQGFLGNPPKSNVSFIFEGETITSIGEFNNKILTLLFSDNESDRALAKKMAEFARDSNPIYLPIRYNLGRIYSSEGNLSAALREFKMAGDIFPEYYRTFLHIGHIHASMKNDREAEIYYKKAYRLVYLPTEPGYYLCTLSFRTREGSVFRKISEKKPEEDLSFWGSLCLAEKNFSGGKKKLAFKILKDLDTKKETFPIPGRFYYLLGELAFDSSQKEIAKSNFKILLDKKFDPIFLNVNRKTIERKFREIQTP